MHSHEIQQLKQTLVLMLLNFKNIIEYFGFYIPQNETPCWFNLNFYYKFQHSKQLVKIQLHLINLSPYDICVFLLL